ncbi:hypothetical protein DL93DRAFT_2088690 [Clavulina sp. PMI_390]|nr:hypothetical protein DL93DRAFT_2088690 [Clavulina sp. PMI_390]
MMSIETAGGSKNALNLPFDAYGQREWSLGLMGACSHTKECCYSCWCPSCQYANVHSRLDYIDKHGRPHPEGGDTCNTHCLTFHLLLHCGLQCIPGGRVRRHARERYRIGGSTWKDWCSMLCCMPNALTQLSNEIRLEESAISGAPVKS